MSDSLGNPMSEFLALKICSMHVTLITKKINEVKLAILMAFTSRTAVA